MFKTGAAIAVAAMTMIACAGPASSPAAPDPDEPVTSTPSDAGAGPGAHPTVSPRAGLVDVRARQFEVARPIHGGDRIKVSFWSGVEGCYGLDHIDVQYRPKTVTITLFEGRDPEAEVCIEVAVYKVTIVELGEPLGDRRIVDGGA